MWSKRTRIPSANPATSISPTSCFYARDLLRHQGARPELQARYDRVFVDEFQDTDPLQAEILTTLASPEKLFVVGDPKQSIYRFRRADPRVYFDVR